MYTDRRTVAKGDEGAFVLRRAECACHTARRETDSTLTLHRRLKAAVFGYELGEFAKRLSHFFMSQWGEFSQNIPIWGTILSLLFQMSAIFLVFF